MGAGNVLNISIPGDAVLGETYARFRLSEESALGPNGFAASGEVEDIRLVVSNNPFRNPIADSRNDVNSSGAVTPLDALQIINALNRAGTGLIRLDQAPPTDLPDFPDTNGDGVVTFRMHLTSSTNSIAIAIRTALVVNK